MKLFFAGDHAGFELKRKLIDFVRSLGHEVEDLGPFSYDPQDDYPDFIIPAALAISAEPDRARAVVIGGSGQGEAIVCNRFRGVRAAVYCGGNPQMVKVSREHNDSNVLSMGARFVSEGEAKAAVKLWLETPFSGEERHRRRLKKIDTATPQNLGST